MNISDARKKHHSNIREENIRWQNAIKVMREAKRQNIASYYGDNDCYLVVRNSYDLGRAIEIFRSVFCRTFLMSETDIYHKTIRYENRDVPGFYIEYRRS